MAVAFRSESHDIAGGTHNPGEPAGAAQGDVFVALACYADNNATPSIASPAGWTDLYNGTNVVGSNDGIAWRVSVITRGASAPALTWTMSVGYYEIYLLAYSGGVLPVDAQSTTGGTGNTQGHNIDPSAVVAVSSAAMAVCGGVVWQGSAVGGFTAPTGYTLRSNNGAGQIGTMADRLLSSSGSENPGAFGNVSSAGTEWMYWDGFAITIAPPVTVQVPYQPYMMPYLAQ